MCNLASALGIKKNNYPELCCKTPSGKGPGQACWNDMTAHHLVTAQLDLNLKSLFSLFGFHCPICMIFFFPQGSCSACQLSYLSLLNDKGYLVHLD